MSTTEQPETPSPDPETAHPKPEALIKSRPKDVPPDQVKEKTITEKQQETIPENMHWGAEFTLPHSRFFIQAIEAQPDYKEKNWHFVPLQINEEYRHEHEGHKVIVHMLCINDKACLRRLTKFLAKYTAKELNWINIHETTQP